VQRIVGVRKSGTPETTRRTLQLADHQQNEGAFIVALRRGLDRLPAGAIAPVMIMEPNCCFRGKSPIGSE
jgi:hypothetical protein